MKKWYILTVVLLLIALVVTACGKAEKPGKQDDRQVVETDVIVDITVGESGIYDTLCHYVKLTYKDGKVTEIEVNDPKLLAFRVSEKWFGGVRLYHENEIEEIIQGLRNVNYFYDNADLADLIDQLEGGIMMMEAST